LANLTNEKDTYLQERNQAYDTIGRAERHLGITDLTVLSSLNMNGKTLLELVNHRCPTPPSHTCPIINKIECSHSDYEELKQQLGA
jgi:hypothetical protein